MARARDTASGLEADLKQEEECGRALEENLAHAAETIRRYTGQVMSAARNSEAVLIAALKEVEQKRRSELQARRNIIAAALSALGAALQAGQTAMAQPPAAMLSACKEVQELLAMAALQAPALVGRRQSSHPSFVPAVPGFVFSSMKKAEQAVKCSMAQG